MLDGLDRLVEERDGKQPLALDVLVAGFSDELHPTAWTSLTPGSVSGLQAQVRSFASRDSGQDTDFYTAVDGAQQQLARRAAEVTEASQPLPCRLLLMFTDGRFDIDTHGDKPYAAGDLPKVIKNQRGSEALCATNGPMARLRADGTVTIALALDNSAVPGAADPAFLARLTSGACPSPDPAAGVSLDVANASGLLGIFDEVATAIRGGEATAASCSGGPQKFQVPPAVRGFHVFGDAGSPPSGATMTSPDGSTVAISPGSGGSREVGGANVTWRWVGDANRFVVLEGALPAGNPAWAGTWTLDFSAPTADARCRIYLFDAWRLKMTAPKTLHRGSTANLKFEVVDAHGKPARVATLPGAVTVDASVRDLGAAGPATSLTLAPGEAPGQYRSRLPIPDSFVGQQAEVVSNFGFSVDGSRLNSSPVAHLVPVRTPAGYPSIAPTSLRLSSVDGDGVARGFVTIRADAIRDGRVWLDQAHFDSTPVAKSQLTADLGKASTADEPMVVPKGTSERYPVSVHVETSADGTVRGSLIAHVSSSASPAPAQTTIPFTFLMTRPVNDTRRLEVVALLLALALLLPLLLLWILNSLGARFEPPSELRFARIPFAVRPGGPLERGADSDGSPLRLEAEDFANVAAESGSVKRFECAGLQFEAHVPVNPFRAPFGDATSMLPAIGSEGASKHDRNPRAKVPLALPGAWVATIDHVEWSGDEIDHVVVSLVVFVISSVPFDQQADRINDSISGSVADVVVRFAASMPRPPAPDQPDDSEPLLFGLPVVPPEDPLTPASGFTAPPDY